MTSKTLTKNQERVLALLPITVTISDCYINGYTTSVADVRLTTLRALVTKGYAKREIVRPFTTTYVKR